MLFQLRRCCLMMIVAAMAVWRCAPSRGGEVIVEDGTVIRGTPVAIAGLTEREAAKKATYVENTPIIMVSDGMRRYYVTRRRVPRETINADADLDRYEIFKVEQKVARHDWIGQVGGFRIQFPLNEHGRRTIQFATADGTMDVVQGITEINPFYVQFEGITHKMKFGIATTSFRRRDLEPIMKAQIDPNDPNQRLAIVRFYLQAGQVTYALAELTEIRAQFPEIADKVQEMERSLIDEESRRLLAELEKRIQTGQHQLAQLAFRGFENPQILQYLSADQRDELRRLQQQEQDVTRRLEETRLLIGELQAKLPDEKREQAKLPRQEIAALLDAESIPRMQSFLNLRVDESLTPENKLALALSGWILGAENATTDFDNTIRLWEARRLLMEYLRNRDPNDDRSLLSEFEKTEGVDPTTAAALIKYLPPVIETPEAVVGSLQGQVLELKTTPSGSKRPVEYSVLLPMEYSPFHEYPLIVELRPPNVSSKSALTWWGGPVERPEQAQRHGYIVIAPDYLPEGAGGYDYSVDSHHRISNVIRDAMLRFPIHSDKIFLAGHGPGADAAYDYGFAHSDRFAGVIAIAGLARNHCEYTFENDPRLPLYAVDGELDAREVGQYTLMVNAPILDTMIRRGRDAIYAEYVGRGYEFYYDEIHRLFDWMGRKTRDYSKSDMEKVKIVRPCDNRHYWVELGGFSPELYRSDPSTRGASVETIVLKAERLQGKGSQTLVVRYKKARATLWLSPEIVSYEEPVYIRANGRKKNDGILQPSVTAMMEDFRRRADRRHVAWTKLQLD